MLCNPTLEKLQSLKLTGMLKALPEQMELPQCEEVSFKATDDTLSCSPRLPGPT